jgi:hypothetical protein
MMPIAAVAASCAADAKAVDGCGDNLGAQVLPATGIRQATTDHGPIVKRTRYSLCAVGAEVVGAVAVVTGAVAVDDASTPG